MVPVLNARRVASVTSATQRPSDSRRSSVFVSPADRKSCHHVSQALEEIRILPRAGLDVFQRDGLVVGGWQRSNPEAAFLIRAAGRDISAEALTAFAILGEHDDRVVRCGIALLIRDETGDVLPAGGQFDLQLGDVRARRHIEPRVGDIHTPVPNALQRQVRIHHVV